MMAIVAEGRARTGFTLHPNAEHESIATSLIPRGRDPETDLPDNALGFRIQLYGMTVIVIFSQSGSWSPLLPSAILSPKRATARM